MAIVPVADLSLFLVDQGEGAPVIFLHGMPLDHHMWRHQAAALSGRCRVLIPDLRGFGRTAGASDKTTMDRLADDVLELLGVLGLTEPVTVCGLSMGGYLALLLARKAPERLRALVLCDCRSQPDAPEAAANRLVLADRVLTDGPRIVAESMLPRLFAHHTNECNPVAVDEIRDVILAGSSRGIAAAQRGMAEREDLTPFLSQIVAPTLVICGEEDAISPLAEMRSLARQIPGAEFVAVPDAGHMAPLEQPTAVNAALTAFLERHGILS